MSMVELLESVTESFGDDDAIIFGQDQISYRQLNSQANRIACVLTQKFGVGRGDRVAVLLKNHPKYAAALFGIFKAGAAALPVNTFLAAEELKFILDDSEVSLVLTSSDFDKVIDSVRNLGTNAKFVMVDEDAEGDKSLPQLSADMSPENPAVSVGDDDVAMFVYTSGTTGKPKAAMLTHNNLCANVKSSVEHIKLVHEDIFLCILPMFHSFTLMVNLFVPLSVGAKIVMVESIFPLERVLEALIGRKCTVLVGIPQLFNMLAFKELPDPVKQQISLRMCISGSAPLSEATLAAFQKNFNIPLLEGYGLSEASPVVSVNPFDGARKVGSVGLTLPEVEVNIFDDDDNEVATGEAGEVVVRGPNVMKEYYRREEDTAQVLKNGWLHTGDIGKLDQEGYLYIIDRKKDMLISKGMNIYPREIEEALHQHPKVAEAAVVGRMDQTKSETPVAFVSLREAKSAEQAEIIGYLKNKLARYKIPREVIFLEEFPRTPTGKILKRKLRQQLHI